MHISTHFFIHTYFQKIQTTLLEQRYETVPLFWSQTRRVARFIVVLCLYKSIFQHNSILQIPHLQLLNYIYKNLTRSYWFETVEIHLKIGLGHCVGAILSDLIKKWFLFKYLSSSFNKWLQFIQLALIFQYQQN